MKNHAERIVTSIFFYLKLAKTLNIVMGDMALTNSDSVMSTGVTHAFLYKEKGILISRYAKRGVFRTFLNVYDGAFLET